MPITNYATTPALSPTSRAGSYRRRKLAAPECNLHRYFQFCSSAEGSGEEAAFPERERGEGFLVGFCLDCSMMKVVARLKRLAQSGKAFFVTTNLSRGLPRLVPKEHDLICQAVSQVCRRRRARLSGFVVMPDHLHLLVLLALEDSLSRFVQDLKSGTARRINSRRRTSGAFWQKGFFDRFMRTPQEFLETLDYIVDFLDLPAQAEKHFR
jgi:REP element-mobilizing transposase RayT